MASVAALDQINTSNDARQSSVLDSVGDALRRGQRNPFARTETGPAMDGWKVVEILSTASSSHGSAGLLLSSRIFGQGTDDVLVIDSESGRLFVPDNFLSIGSFVLYFPGEIECFAGERGGDRLFHPYSRCPDYLCDQSGITKRQSGARLGAKRIGYGDFARYD
jgi:hypothetical protein